MPRGWLVATTAVVALTAIPSAAAARTETGVIVIKVTVSTGCGPGDMEGPPPQPAPFDANVRVRNRKTGRLWILRSGRDGKVRHRFPPGPYKVEGGKPHDGGIAYTKDRVYLTLSRCEVERVSIGYDNGCR